MDKIWWQKVLCEFHVVRKHKTVEGSKDPGVGRGTSDAERFKLR
jgi:hypothetical protein